MMEEEATGTIWAKIAAEKERQGIMRTKIKATYSGSSSESSYESQNVPIPLKSTKVSIVSPSTPSESERARLSSSDYKAEEPATQMNIKSPREGRHSDYSQNAFIPSPSRRSFIPSPSSVSRSPALPLASDSQDNSIRNSSRRGPKTTSLKSPTHQSSSSGGMPSPATSAGSKNGSSYNFSPSTERDEAMISPSTSWPPSSEYSISLKSGGGSRHKRDSSTERQEGTYSDIWSLSSEHDASLSSSGRSGTRIPHTSPSHRNRETVSANTPSPGNSLRSSNTSTRNSNLNSAKLQTPRQVGKRISADGTITIIPAVPDLSMPLESPVNSETKSSSFRSSTNGKRGTKPSSVSSSITTETKPNSFTNSISSGDAPVSADTPTSRRRRLRVNPPTTIGEGSLQSMPQLDSIPAGTNDSNPHEMVIERDLRDGQGSKIFNERRDGEEKEEEDRDLFTQQTKMGVPDDVSMNSCLRKSSSNSKAGSQHTASGIDSTKHSSIRVQIKGGRESSPATDESVSKSCKSTTHVWGSVRHVKPEDKIPTEWWVYVVALVLFFAATGSLSMVVLFVFGAAGSSLSDEETLVDQLQHLSSHPSVFEDPDSPQSLALNWLTNEDKSGLDLDDTDRVESRYALAVLYFATSGGDMWIDKLQFLSPLHECEWISESGSGAGVGCDSEMRVVNVTIPSNNLRDIVPEEVNALAMLATLDLSYNNLSGTIPSFTFELLKSLHLGMNEFSGSFPASLSDLSSLTSLDLSGNQLESALPTTINALLNLKSLLLGSNDFTGTIPFQIQSLSNLRELNVTANKFHGFIDFIENFPQLEILDVSLNKFGGTIPEIIGDLDRLEVLVFSDNEYSGSLPSIISNLRSLQILAGDSNFLRGTFPWSSFTDANQFIQISMSDNILSGELPLDLNRFSTLEVLDFKRNKLQGSIPNSIGGLSNLKYLQLSLNRFTGKLPASLGLLTSMTALDVSANDLSSTIPPTLGSLRYLETLELDSNDLFGEVPTELADLESLERLGLQSNRLEGDIEFLCSMESSPLISADCGGDPPPVTCSCCSVCVE